MKGWSAVDEIVYKEAYAKYGGSLITHPEVIKVISDFALLEASYFAVIKEDKVIGAVASWGKYIVGDKRALKDANKRRAYDLGNAEVIFPFKENEKLTLRYKSQFLSILHKDNIPNARRSKYLQLCMAKSHDKEGLSKKFKYNRRRELRIFTDAGGEVLDIKDLSSKAIAESYIRLFAARWGKKPKGYERMGEFIDGMRDYLFGQYLYMDERISAIQIIYLVVTAKGISAEYINGGYDPSIKSYSPGSILCFLNTRAAEKMRKTMGKSLRYSFGKNDEEYKKRWCYPEPLYYT